MMMATQDSELALESSSSGSDEHIHGLLKLMDMLASIKVNVVRGHVSFACLLLRPNIWLVQIFPLSCVAVSSQSQRRIFETGRNTCVLRQ